MHLEDEREGESVDEVMGMTKQQCTWNRDSAKVPAPGSVLVSFSRLPCFCFASTSNAPFALSLFNRSSSVDWHLRENVMRAVCLNKGAEDKWLTTPLNSSDRLVFLSSRQVVWLTDFIDRLTALRGGATLHSHPAWPFGG
jgi:hypothetical protein